MGKTDIGQGKQALALAGGGVAGYVGTTTVTYTATSVTYTAASGWVASTGTNYGTAGNWAGYIVVAGGVYGVVVSNTTTVLTVDRWYNPASPTGAAGTTPSANTTFVIVPGNAPVFYMALSANATVAVTDTQLTSELTTNGLGRVAGTFAHTFSNSSANNTYTLSNTWTYTGSTTQNINSVGTFDCATAASGIMLHETQFPAQATVASNGDQLTVTQTVTM